MAFCLAHEGHSHSYEKEKEFPCDAESSLMEFFEKAFEVLSNELGTHSLGSRICSIQKSTHYDVYIFFKKKRIL